MLILVSRRFPVLDEVSFSTRTLPNRLRNGAKELLLYILFQSIDVTKYKVNNDYSSYLRVDTTCLSRRLKPNWGTVSYH